MIEIPVTTFRLELATVDLQYHVRVSFIHFVSLNSRILLESSSRS